MEATTLASQPNQKQAQGPWGDLALHTLGWKAFQDLCSHVCEAILNRPVEIYREAQDGGQDAVFMTKAAVPHPATVQCKFSSKVGRSLKLADLTAEEAHIIALKAQGQADTYCLMTNMSVDAPVVVAIKARLRHLGVVHPHVYGKEFLTRVIRGSAQLRALVPRVYGLGDLSIILDERQATQTKALLGHMLPTLQVYVPTKPHVDAVKKLGKHGIVLLLGDPATGKSTIAAILATTVAEQAGRICYKIDAPHGLLASWNPHEPKAFYWIDDAFGPNQPREDYIDQWVAIMDKVRAATAAGCQFVLTSRRHIYEAAKPKLGTRNHPLFRDGEAVVHVGGLSVNEREQIIYNHIKAGSQSILWKYVVKPHLSDLAKEPGLLPEIARRLADPAYTTNITTARDNLIKFVREPKDYLIQTIDELPNAHRGALTLVFLHRGQMPMVADPEMERLVLRYHDVGREALWQGVSHLRDSFLVQTKLSGDAYWNFKHPTIADAVSTILGRTSALCELYLRGTKPETIITEAICAEVPTIEDAVVVPQALEDLLVQRLAEVPDEARLNRELFAFLYWRASESVFRKCIIGHPEILARECQPSFERLAFNPQIRVHARAHRLGILGEEVRSDSEIRLEKALREGDTSFLDQEDVLSLISPRMLMHLGLRLRDEVLSGIPDRAEDVADEADLDIAPESNFDDLSDMLSDLRSFFDEEDGVSTLIEKAEKAISRGIERVGRAKECKDNSEEGDDDERGWRDRAPATTKSGGSFVNGSRSIFSDVDE